MSLNTRPVFGYALISLVTIGLSGCDTGTGRAAPKSAGEKNLQEKTECTKPALQLLENESLISILGTNDMHGAVKVMPFWAGAVKSVRDGVKKRYGSRGGVLVLDGGDQFQGTLLSNYTEGALMFSLMGEAAYDAVVPGNHDYDFGPDGWLIDKVTATSQDQDPRGVIKRLAASASFPLLSANTYYKASLKTIDGKPATVQSVGCVSAEPLDWSKAERPEFLKPSVIKEIAGVRVAIIGLDNPSTPTTTIAANITDLCFRTAAEEYKAVRESLDGKADVFVIVIHDGDIKEDKNLTTLIDTLQAWRPDAVDAVVGGHTHMVNLIERKGVFGIQSGANGKMFGRLDLVVDLKTKKVLRDKTRAAAGAELSRTNCDPQIGSFCAVEPDSRLTYECETVTDLPSAVEKVAVGLEAIKPLLGRNLGFAKAPIRRERDNESALLNLINDTFRKFSGAEVAMVNTGGIRTDIESGPFTYEKLFAISPFNNRAVILSPMKISTLVKVMERSARSCGKYGAVLASGIRVTYRRGDCKNAQDGMDPSGKVITISMDNGGRDGELLYDARDPQNIQVSNRELRVATLDFLESGGSGYTAFKEVPRVADLGIFRELLADELAKNPGKLEAVIDGRFVNENAR